MSIDKGGFTLNQLDSCFFKFLIVYLTQTMDFLLLSGNELLPIKGVFGLVPAIACGNLRIIRELSSKGHQFFRNTASDDTGTAYGILFCDRNTSTIASRLFGSSKSSRSGTNYKKVIIEFHNSIGLSLPNLRSRFVSKVQSSLT